MGRRPPTALGLRPTIAIAFLAVLLLPGSALSGLPVGSRNALAPALSPASGVYLVGPASLPPGGAGVHPAAPDLPISLAISLALPDPTALSERIQSEYTPGTPEFGQFLTPTELSRSYGPSESEYGRAVAYFQSFGLTVTTSPDRTLLFVEGPASSAGPAFATSFSEVRAGPNYYYGTSGPATLPSDLPWGGVVGLSNLSSVRPTAAPSLGPAVPPSAPAASGCANSSWATPCELRTAYNASTLIGAGDNGSGVRIGLVDAYDGLEPQPTLLSDYAGFVQNFSLPYGNVSLAYPDPWGGNMNRTSQGWELEDALDLEWARALAPGASIIQSLSPGSDAGLYEAVDWFVAHDSVDVLSMSWGENDVGLYNAFAGRCSAECNATSDGSYQTLHPVLEAAAAEGISAFAASGDCGAADGTSKDATNYPASDPYVVGVGGTNLDFGAGGAWASENGWTGNASGATASGCYNQGGSGGGFSPFARPFWQSGTGLGSAPPLRGVPDVAMLAGSPGAEVDYHGGIGSTGGTSLSSPLWADLTADADTLAKGRVGFLDPALYSIANGASGKSAFHDITQGWNGYNAGNGWDPVTGLGSPNAAVLLPLFVKHSVTLPTISVNLSANPRYGNAPLTVDFAAAATGGSGTFPLIDVGFGDGNSSASSTGRSTHTFADPGVYVAQATAFDSAGNSSISGGLAVVVGGTDLSVTISANVTHPAVGATVGLTARVTGGTPAYSYSFLFGDGTYEVGSNRSTAGHAYEVAGAYCAQVLVSDSAHPEDGGISEGIGIRVGAGGAVACATQPPIATSVSPSAAALDLPGGFGFRATPSGGVPPYAFAYFRSDDPYESACGCGLFSTAGNHTVTAWVSDSENGIANASTSVTLYPRLTGTFTASVLTGPTPLTVDFTARLSGGHAANGSDVQWVFGNGANATGSDVNATYATAGSFVAYALASDPYGGHASEAFLIDAYASGPPPATVVTGSVAPALDVPAGTIVDYFAQASGSAGPYTVRWSLGNGGSAYGSSVEQTYPYAPCPGACDVNVTVEVLDGAGRIVNRSIDLAGAIDGNGTALHLLLSPVGAGGPTPYRFQENATVFGLPNANVSWTFGNGAGVSSDRASFTYLTPGNYTVSATATDPLGDTLIETRAVEVTGLQRYPPAVHATLNVSSGYAPLTVEFNASASGGAGAPYSYLWSYGDGAGAVAPTPTHTYELPGTYTANLTVYDLDGVSNSTSLIVQVYADASLGFSVSGLANRTAGVGPGTWNVSAIESVTCPAQFADPSCRTIYPALRYLLEPTGDAPPNNSSAGVREAIASANGTATLSVPVPTAPGNFTLYLWPDAIGFTGLGHAEVSVEPGRVTISPPAHPMAPFPWDLVAAGIAAAGLGAIAVAVWWRGRRGGANDPRGPRSALDHAEGTEPGDAPG